MSLPKYCDKIVLDADLKFSKLINRRTQEKKESVIPSGAVLSIKNITVNPCTRSIRVQVMMSRAVKEYYAQHTKFNEQSEYFQEYYSFTLRGENVDLLLNSSHHYCNDWYREINTLKK